MALLGLFVSLAACSKDTEPTKESKPLGQMKADPNADGDPEATATAQVPTLAQAAPTIPKGALETTRQILSQTLNATVKGKSRFESVPLYQLELDIDYELFTFDAHQKLTYVNTEKDTLKELYFLVYPNSPELAEPGAKNLAIGDASVNGQAVKADMDGQLLHIPLNTPLAPGQTAVVDIDFRGTIVRLPPGADDMQALAMQQLVQMVMGHDGHQQGGYGVYAYADGVVSMALWYPVLAAYDDNGWDIQKGTDMGDVSYFDVSNYEVTVKAPSDVQVIGTGVEVARREENGKRTTTFQAGAVREFTVEMSRDFTSSSDFVDGVKVTSYYLKHHTKSGKKVLAYGTQALKLYNEAFGPYPYTELDLVEAPLVGGAGGVEFPGLTTIARMFYAPDNPPAPNPNAQSGFLGLGGDWGAAMHDSPYMKDTLEFVVAHEVAHQWWNAVVGSDSKRHPFVDEALANHSAIYYFEKTYGKAAADIQTEIQLRLPYQISRLAGAADRPVDLPTSEYKNMMEYAATVYGKGALYFGEMRTRNGDASHFGFLKDYYGRFQFKVARPDDLIGGLADASRDPAATRALSERWLRQSHGDEDIGGIRIAVVAKYMLGGAVLDGAIGQVIELLDHKGAQEVAKLVQNLISEDGTVNNVDYGEIIKMVLALFEADEDMDGLAAVANLLGKNPDLLKSGDMRGVLKGLAKAGLGGDEKTDAIIDVADSLLKLLESSE